jgi:hypothetical protein
VLNRALAAIRHNLVASLAVFVALGGMLSLGIARPPAAAAGAPSRICFYVQSRLHGILSTSGTTSRISPTGHAFVQLLPGEGPQAGSRRLVYGFFTKNIPGGLTVGAKGIVDYEGEHEWDWKICYAVSKDSYDKAAALIRRDEANPPEYILLKFNCTDWIASIASQAAIMLPPYSANLLRKDSVSKRLPDFLSFLKGPVENLTPEINISLADPERLSEELKRLYERKADFQGGIVYGNFKHVTPTDAVDPPTTRLDLDSVEDIVTLGLQNPSRLATGLGLAVRDEKLGAVHVGVGRELETVLRKREGDIVDIRFGDGTAAAQQSTFSHTFRRPGVYVVRGVAIGSTVERFSFRVVVEPGSRRAVKTILVHHDSLPPSTLAPLLPDVAPLPE